jgi:hypothetical protein
MSVLQSDVDAALCFEARILNDTQGLVSAPLHGYGAVVYSIANVSCVTRMSA